MESESKLTERPADPVRRPSRLWLYFVGGFGLVFIGMLLLVKMLVIHPSGQFLERHPLWRYYELMLPRMFSTTLGPASGGTSALVETAAFHLLFSTAGGCVAAGGVWLLRKSRYRKSTQQGGS